MDLLSSQFGPCCCEYEHLTGREIEVLEQAAAGRGNKEIARQLAVSVHTVERHMQSMLRKAQASSRTGLVTRAYQTGILTVGESGPAPTGRTCMRA
jgi:DNA-binding NarL/FixJ family response regulator